MLVHRKIGTLSHATTHYINVVHFLASKDVCIRSVNERGFMHTVECTCDIITLLQLENTSSCRVFFSLAPIYVYQHLFYWIEKFVQSFNMWIKKPMCEIDFWAVVVLLVWEEHMEESERLMYIYTLKSVGFVTVWTHLRY